MIAMENDDEMQRFMEQLLPYFYSDFVPNPKNIVASELFIPYGCITKNLFENVKTILCLKIVLVLQRWKNVFAIWCLKALSSHEMYFRYVMFACGIEIRLSDDIFDGLLSSCALVIAFVTETYFNTEVNFCELTVDILMVFYKFQLKEKFYTHGGFPRLEEYIHQEYLARKNYFSRNSGDSNVSGMNMASFLKNTNINLGKEQKKFQLHPTVITHNDIIRNDNCLFLAKEVLSTTKLSLPILPSKTQLKVRLRSFKNRKAPTLEERRSIITVTLKCETVAALNRESTTPASKRESTTPASKRESTTPVSQQCLSLDVDFQTTRKVEQKANITWCNKIVQEVITYNNSKCSGLENANNRIQKEADEILEHLKDTIKSLKEVLEDSVNT